MSYLEVSLKHGIAEVEPAVTATQLVKKCDISQLDSE